jgi:hypothetical protein
LRDFIRPITYSIFNRPRPDRLVQGAWKGVDGEEPSGQTAIVGPRLGALESPSEQALITIVVKRAYFNGNKSTRPTLVYRIPVFNSGPSPGNTVGIVQGVRGASTRNASKPNSQNGRK